MFQRFRKYYTRGGVIVKKLHSAPPYGRLLALPTNIREGWKGLPGIKTLAYYVKRFIVQAPGLSCNAARFLYPFSLFKVKANVIKLFIF
jgi:hypothetical protein